MANYERKGNVFLNGFPVNQIQNTKSSKNNVELSNCGLRWGDDENGDPLYAQFWVKTSKVLPCTERGNAGARIPVAGKRNINIGSPESKIALKIVDASNNVKEQTSVSAEELQSHWKKLQAEYKKTVKHNRNLRLNELPLESSSVEDSPEYSE